MSSDDTQNHGVLLIADLLDVSYQNAQKVLIKYGSLTNFYNDKVSIFQKLAKHKLQSRQIINVSTATSYFQNYLFDKKHEICCAMFLDKDFKIIKFEKLFQGTINKVAIYIRPIIHKTLEYKAQAIILAHNHPSGDIQPSSADLKVTKDLKKALSFIDTTLLDHLVINDLTTFSILKNQILKA